MALRGEELAFFVAGLGLLSALVLAFSVWLATKARKPPQRKPPRRTFEHGRRLGRLARPTSTEAALQALRAAPVGQVSSAHDADGRVDVVLERRRSQPCAQAAGYLAGLFESAWAHEVLVTHPECAGDKAGTCHYVVQRAAIGTGARAGEASTPGSADAPRRSPRARPGGG